MVNAPGILANDTPGPNDVLSVLNCGGSSNGSLNSDAQGGFTFTPMANFIGLTTFMCTISNGNGGTDTSTTTLLVTPEGFAVDDTFTIFPGQPLTVNAPGILANDNPGPNDVLSVQTCTGADDGSVTFDTQGGFTFIPLPSFVGVTSFTCTISNGNGETDTSTATVFVTPDGFALDDSFTIPPEQPFTVNAPGLLANDLSGPNDVLSVQGCSMDGSNQNSGTLTFNVQGGFTFDPMPNFIGEVIFMCVITNGNGGSDTSTTTIVVTPDGFAIDDTFTTPPGQTLSVNAPGILENDNPGSNDVLSVQSCSMTNPSSGTLTFDMQGGFTYIPSSSFEGATSFICVVSNGNGGIDTSTSTIFVTPDGFAVDDTFTIPPGQPLTVNAPGLLANDLAGPNDVLSVQSCSVDIQNTNSGIVTFNAQGGFTFTPMPSFVGVTSFTCTISNGNGGTDTSTTSVIVASDGFAVDDTYTIPPGQPFTVNAPGLLANDISGPNDVLSVQSCSMNGSNSASGTLNFDMQGGFTFTPTANFLGVTGFTCTISNGNGGTDTSTTSIIVTSNPSTGFTVPDTFITPPGQTIIINAPGILGNDNPGPDGILIVQLCTQPNVGTLDNWNAQGSFTYTPPSDGFTGIAFFTCTVVNGSGGSDTSQINISIMSPPTPSVPTISPAPTPLATLLPPSGGGLGGGGGFLSQLTTLSSAFFQGVLDLSFTTVNGASSLFQLIFTFIFGSLLGGIGGISIWGLWDWFYYYCLSYYCYY